MVHFMKQPAAEGRKGGLADRGLLLLFGGRKMRYNGRRVQGMAHDQNSDWEKPCGWMC